MNLASIGYKPGWGGGGAGGGYLGCVKSSIIWGSWYLRVGQECPGGGCGGVIMTLGSSPASLSACLAVVPPWGRAWWHLQVRNGALDSCLPVCHNSSSSNSSVQWVEARLFVSARLWSVRSAALNYGSYAASIPIAIHTRANKLPLSVGRSCTHFPTHSTSLFPSELIGIDSLIAPVRYHIVPPPLQHLQSELHLLKRESGPRWTDRACLLWVWLGKTETGRTCAWHFNLSIPKCDDPNLHLFTSGARLTKCSV